MWNHPSINVTIGDIYLFESDHYIDFPHRFEDNKEQIVEDYLSYAQFLMMNSENEEYRVNPEEFNTSFEKEKELYDSYKKNEIALANFPVPHYFCTSEKMYTFLIYEQIAPNYEGYPLFFFLKLTQFEDKYVFLDDFLNNQNSVYSVFKPGGFERFISLILKAYGKYISKELFACILEWVDNFRKTKDSVTDVIPAIESLQKDFPLRPKSKVEEIITLHFIIKYLQDNPNNDHSSGRPLTRIAHAIYGRNFTNDDGSVYKKISSAPAGPSGKKTEQMILDLKKVKDKFEMLGLTDIAKNIK